jgi:hypothetical protein
MKSTSPMVAVILALQMAIPRQTASSEDLSANLKRSHLELYETDYLRNQANQRSFDWQTLGPTELLDVLRKERAKGVSVFPCYAIHYRWIKEQDIQALVQQVDNDEKCSVVTMPLDSGLPPNGSTIGAEARHLIVGFWKGYYPVEANSTKIRVTNDEIKQWYRVWRKQFN